MLLEARLGELEKKFLAAESHLISEQAVMEAMAPFQPRQVILVGDDGKKSGSVEFIVDTPGIGATNRRIWEQIQQFLAQHPRYNYHPPSDFYFKENGTLTIQLKNLDKWGFSPRPKYGFLLEFDPDLMIPVREDCTSMCWNYKGESGYNTSQDGSLGQNLEDNCYFFARGNRHPLISGKLCLNDISIVKIKFELETPSDRHEASLRCQRPKRSFLGTQELDYFFKHMGYANGTAGLFQR